MHEVGKYSTRISYSAEDQGFIATVPELPGCSAFGETAAEALNEIVPAIEAWISAAEAAGNPVPQPAPLDAELPSGKFLVRVAKTVHAQLTAAAQREGVSLNHYVATVLATASLGDIYSRATTNGVTTAVTSTATRSISAYQQFFAGNQTRASTLVVADDLARAIEDASARMSEGRTRKIYTYKPESIIMTTVESKQGRRSRTLAHG